MIADIQFRTLSIESLAVNSTKHLVNGEAAELAWLRSLKRQREYLAGRLLGKQLLCQLSGAAPAEIEILSRDANRRPARPRVLISGRPTDWQLSISHCADRVLAVATDRTDIRIGCDLVTVEPLGRGFVEMWFADSEQNWLDSPGGLPASVAWAGKEAAFKAMNQGEKFAPRRFEVAPSHDQWQCKYTFGSRQRTCQLELIEMKAAAAMIAEYPLKKAQYD